MTRDQFAAIIESGEGYRVEFKEGFSDKIDREMVAFANSGGGKIYIGISDNGKLKGVTITNKLKSQVDDIARNCDPSIPITMRELKREQVLVVSVKSGHDKPYRCKSGFYVRSGSSSQKMTRNEIRDFMATVGKIVFDSDICNEFSYRKHFDAEKLQAFLSKAKISRNIGGWGFNFGEDWGGGNASRDRIEILKNLGVVKVSGAKVNFNNAGVLFFAKNLGEIYLHTEVSCALFKGRDKSYTIDRKTFNADILSNVDGAMAFLHRHLNLSYKFSPGKVQREEVLEIPEGALREAVVNAIVHRDYLDKRTNVKVEIYDDRVAINSFGGLPAGLNKRTFRHKSIPRNPLLADLMLRVGYVEKMGTGIRKIHLLTEKAGLPPVQFKIDKFSVDVIFPRTVVQR